MNRHIPSHDYEDEEGVSKRSVSDTYWIKAIQTLLLVAIAGIGGYCWNTLSVVRESQIRMEETLKSQANFNSAIDARIRVIEQRTFGKP